MATLQSRARGLLKGGRLGRQRGLTKKDIVKGRIVTAIPQSFQGLTLFDSSTKSGPLLKEANSSIAKGQRAIVVEHRDPDLGAIFGLYKQKVTAVRKR